MKKLTLSLLILTLVFSVNITSAQTDGPYMYTFVDSKEGKGTYTLVENEENIFMEVILKSSQSILTI